MKANEPIEVLTRVINKLNVMDFIIFRIYEQNLHMMIY